MVGFNVNHKQLILQHSNPHALFPTMFLPLTSRLVGVGVLSNKLPCSCSSHTPSEACVWPTWNSFHRSNKTGATREMKLCFSLAFYKSWSVLLPDKTNLPLQKSLFHRKMALLSPASTQPTGTVYNRHTNINIPP